MRRAIPQGTDAALSQAKAAAIVRLAALALGGCSPSPPAGPLPSLPGQLKAQIGQRGPGLDGQRQQPDRHGSPRSRERPITVKQRQRRHQAETSPSSR